MQDSPWRKILIHLRFPFSVFLLPVYIMGWTHAFPVDSSPWWLFIVLHALVYPSSNGYNSYMDQDSESIGGIQKPTEVPRSMFSVSILFDTLAMVIVWSLYGLIPFLLLTVYILASRAYSYRKIRLKKFPIIGYLTVFVFQGGWIFLLCMISLTNDVVWTQELVLGMFVASLMIGASYPLTQVYQHKQDGDDGVQTISMLLGVKGTFVFSGALFLIFNVLAFIYLQAVYHSLIPFILLLLASGPAAVFLLSWVRKVWNNENEANYKNAMRMSTLGSIGMNIAFGLILILKITQVELPF